MSSARCPTGSERVAAEISAIGRLGIVSRVLASAIGGYAMAAALAMALAVALPLDRSEAVVTATLLGVLAMPFAAIWAFAARTALRAWIGIGAVTGAAALVAWLAGASL